MKAKILALIVLTLLGSGAVFVYQHSLADDTKILVETNRSDYIEPIVYGEVVVTEQPVISEQTPLEEVPAEVQAEENSTAERPPEESNELNIPPAEPIVVPEPEPQPMEETNSLGQELVIWMRENNTRLSPSCFSKILNNPEIFEMMKAYPAFHPSARAGAKMMNLPFCH